MKIKFIGTSSGKTSLTRFHSSILVSYNTYNLLIDAGDGISRALLSNEISFNSLNGILFTHLHPDHFSGLPALIVQMKMMNRVTPLDIFVHESLKKAIEKSLLKSYLLAERKGFKIVYRNFKDNEPYEVINKLRFIARKNSHLNELEKYRDSYPDLSLYSASFLFEAESRKVVYTSDIGSADDLNLFSEILPDVFITEVTHIQLESIIKKIESLASGRIYLTHYSDDDMQKIDEILAILPDNVKEKIKLARDGYSFEI